MMDGVVVFLASLALMLLVLAACGYRSIHHTNEFEHRGYTCTFDLDGIRCAKI